MIQTMEAPHGGAIMYHTVGVARRRARKRMLGIAVVLSMAVSGALVNAVQSRTTFESRTSEASADMLPPGPFSFFPH